MWAAVDRLVISELHTTSLVFGLEVETIRQQSALHHQYGLLRLAWRPQRCFPQNLSLYSLSQKNICMQSIKDYGKTRISSTHEICSSQLMKDCGPSGTVVDQDEVTSKASERDELVAL